MKAYLSLSTLFWLIRQYAIPNPFDALGEGLTITIGEAPLLLTPEVLNWIADPIIGAITFGIVGLYYLKGSDPEFGSFLYMVFYAVHIGLLYLMAWAYPAMWLIALIGIVYIGLHIAALIRMNEIGY